jgi:hypothetical protein
MAEACTATGGCKLGPLREVLGRKREGAATPKFRLQPDAQSAVRRGASIGIAVCQSLCPCAGQLSGPATPRTAAVEGGAMLTFLASTLSQTPHELA